MAFVGNALNATEVRGSRRNLNLVFTQINLNIFLIQALRPPFAGGTGTPGRRGRRNWLPAQVGQVPVQDLARGDGHGEEAHRVTGLVAGDQDILAWREIERECLVRADVLAGGDGGRELEPGSSGAVRLPGLLAAQGRHRSGG